MSQSLTSRKFALAMALRLGRKWPLSRGWSISVKIFLLAAAAAVLAPLTVASAATPASAPPQVLIDKARIDGALAQMVSSECQWSMGFIQLKAKSLVTGHRGARAPF